MLYVPDKQGDGARSDEGPSTNADDGEGSFVSTPTATHQLEGDTELLEEKGRNLIIIMILTCAWFSIHSSSS